MILDQHSEAPVQRPSMTRALGAPDVEPKSYRGEKHDTWIAECRWAVIEISELHPRVPLEVRLDVPALTAGAM